MIVKNVTLTAGLIFCSLATTLQASEQKTFESIVRQKCLMEPLVVLAVSLVESKKYVGNGMVSPHKFAFNSPDGSYYAKDLKDARNYLREQLAKYHTRNIDVGFMQTNLYWQRARYESPYDLLDVEKNIEVGCKALEEAIASEENIVLGIGKYHTWNDKRRAMEYGLNVINVWNNLKN